MYLVFSFKHHNNPAIGRNNYFHIIGLSQEVELELETSLCDSKTYFTSTFPKLDKLYSVCFTD